MRSSDPAGDPALTRSGGTAATPVPGDDSPYWTFYEEVAARQVAAWAPAAPSRVLDLSGGRARFARQLVASGHEVLHVCREPGHPGSDTGSDTGSATGTGTASCAPGRLRQVAADARSLGWLRDGSVDAVLAESRALSLCLAAEVTLADLARVLRPGGRLLLCVDSLGLGLARLAEQGRWAELADVPSADVVLVPDSTPGTTGSGDTITRCFWPEELEAIVTEAGLAVDVVRPRTVLTPAAVERALAHGGRAALGTLTTTELALAERRAGESPGLHLLVSAHRPG